MKRTRNLTVLAVLLGLVGAILVTTAAFGEPGTPIVVDQGVLRLHMEDGDHTPTDDYFRYQPITGVDQTQYIEQGSKCDQLSLVGPLVVLEAAAGNPGQVDDGLGVRVTGPQGTRCGQIDDGEQLILRLGSALSGKKIEYAEIDFEIKYDATVLVDFYDGGTWVDDQEIACDPELSDCGPDSTDGDNYRELVAPPNGAVFDEIRLSLIPSGPNAAASLEGGADGTAALPGGLGESLDTLDSVFHIVRVYDGTLNCGDKDFVGDATTPIQGTIKRLENANCIPKPYSLSLGTLGDDDVLTFDPDDVPDNPQEALYSGTISAVQDSPETNPTEALLRWDPVLDDGIVLNAMQWCDWARFDTDADGFRYVSSAGIPDGERGCIADENTTVGATGEVRATWMVYFEDDPMWAGR